MRKKRVWVGLLVGLVVGLTFGSMAVRSAGGPVNGLPEEMAKPLTWLLGQVQDKYVEEVSHKKLLVGAYQGMLSAADRYGEYRPAAMIEELGPDADGRIRELGMSVRFLPLRRAVLVERSVPGGPAFQRGLLTGDIIVEIREGPGGEPRTIDDFHDIYDVIGALQDPQGTESALTVVHAGDGSKEELALGRKPARTSGLGAPETIGPDRRAGYLYLAFFNERTLDELSSAMADLQGRGVEGIVLDLRFNPGGSLDAAVLCAGMLLDGGVVAEARDRTGPQEVRRAEPGDAFPGVPLVVLVNRYSAGAAEVLAAALRDHKRATLVGETTLGSASEYTVINNPYDGSAVRLTVARYHAPNGGPIEGEGVEPDVEVKLSYEDTRTLAAHVARKMAPARSAGGGGPPEQSERTSGAEPAAEEDEPWRDVQLQRAVEVLLGEEPEGGTAPVSAESAAPVPTASGGPQR